MKNLLTLAAILAGGYTLGYVTTFTLLLVLL